MSETKSPQVAIVKIEDLLSQVERSSPNFENEVTWIEEQSQAEQARFKAFKEAGGTRPYTPIYTFEEALRSLKDIREQTIFALCLDAIQTLLRRQNIKELRNGMIVHLDKEFSAANPMASDLRSRFHSVLRRKVVMDKKIINLKKRMEALKIPPPGQEDAILTLPKDLQKYVGVADADVDRCSTSSGQVMDVPIFALTRDAIEQRRRAKSSGQRDAKALAIVWGTSYEDLKAEPLTAHTLKIRQGGLVGLDRSVVVKIFAFVARYTRARKVVKTQVKGHPVVSKKIRRGAKGKEKRASLFEETLEAVRKIDK